MTWRCTDHLYLDAAAGVPVLPAALQAYLDVHEGNHGSLPHDGDLWRARWQAALGAIADVLGCNADEVTLLGSGTEANAWALRGLLLAAGSQGHVVCSTIEHAAVRRTLEQEAAATGRRLSFVPADSNGVVQPAAIDAALCADTVLVALTAASNETGVCQPIGEVAALCRARDVVLHTDAVQTAAAFSVRPADLPADSVCLSGHKIGAVGGAGLAWVRSGIPWQAPWPRPGSAIEVDEVPDAALAASFAAALAHTAAHRWQSGVGEAGEASLWRRALEASRDGLEADLLARLPHLRVHGQRVARLPHISCLQLPWGSGEGMHMALDIDGIAIGTGSACSAGSPQPPPALLGMGLSMAEARRCIRLSWARPLTDLEQMRVQDAIVRITQAMATP